MSTIDDMVKNALFDQENQKRIAGEKAQADDVASKKAAGPDLQYNPVSSYVRKADGSLVPMDPGYNLQPGEQQVGQLDAAYKLPGSEAYTSALLGKQGIDEASARDKTAQDSQGSLTNAISSLGMRGGINTANRANLVRQNMHDALLADQGVTKQGMNDRANIGVTGAGMQQTADSTNLNNLLTSIGGVNNFNLEKYKQQMAVSSAKTQADATVAAASKDQGKK